MVEILYNEQETDILYWFGEQYDVGNVKLHFTEMPQFKKLERKGLIPILNRFECYGLIECKGNTCVILQPSILHEIDRLKNPPPRDYWKEISIWFRSRPWSIPVFVVLVVLPLIVQWIEMINKVINYFQGEQ